MAALIGNGEPGPWGLAAIGIALFVAFAYASRRAAGGDDPARVAAVVGSTVLTLASGVALLGALWLFGLKCDESCDENVVPEVRSGEWWHTMDAWQWGAQLAAAAVVFAALLAATALTARRRHAAAVGCVAAAGLCFAAWVALVAPLGNAFGV
jgi:hypothetical protein